MCVYFALNKQAITHSAESFQNMVMRGFIQKNKPQLTLEPIVNFLFTVQDEITPQLPILKDTDSIFYDFITNHMDRVDKLRKFEQNLGSTSERKRGEVLEEEKQIIRQVVKNFHMKNNIISKIKPESVQVFNNSLNAGWRYWQTLQQDIRPIFDLYTEDFQEIENYKKKLEKCKCYEGFYFHSVGNWKFTIKNKDNKVFSHNSPMLCLYQKEENDYYPYKYMIICIDFQMENGGATESEAFTKLGFSFDFYFHNILKKKEGLEIISQIIKDRNIWKDTFIELSGIGKKLKGVQNKDHTYCFDTGALP